MLRYETLFVTVPEITSREAENLEKQLEKAVNKDKGAVISFERWGKYHLAYPIRNYDYGVYYLMRFEVDDVQKQSILETLKTLFGVKLADLIMRNIIIRLHPEASLEYTHPESLEEVPSKDIDVILKESKSILTPQDRPSKKPKKEEVKEVVSEEVVESSDTDTKQEG